MKASQSGKNRNIDKQLPGCFGITMNLFDVSAGLGTAGSTKLLTDKPHHDGSSFSTSRSDVKTLVDHLNEDKKVMSTIQKCSSNRKPSGTPMKMLIAQEMSKEVVECNQKSPTNLVAKLMGLDSLPNPTQHTRSKSLSGIPIKFPQHGRSYSESDEYSWYNDIYDKNETPNEKKMDLVRQKEFQDAVQVLSSNKDIFLKFLQERNSIIPSLPKTNRITVLKPAKKIDVAKFSKDPNGYPPEDEDDFNIQPTQIVVLKPGHGDKLSQEENDRVSVQESKEMATGHRKDETMLPSSDFSNGYIGDDSDSEALSPISRHSWEFLNSHHSVSSYSRASYSSESSVCREAKRRLSERWALMASANQTTSVEQRHVRTSSSTLGEMLSLSEEVNGNDKDKPKDLSRSKSLPSSSTVYSDRLNGELPGSGEEKTKKTSGKSSSKWSISSLFFSRSKKSRKEKSGASQCEEEAQSKGGEASESMVYPHEKVLNPDHPSPISVLDQLFEEDDNALPDFSGKHISSQLLRSNLLDKSPRIESVSRTLSWDDDSFGSPSPDFAKPPKKPKEVITEEDKQDWLDFIDKVISLADPLDPSIRDTLCSQYDKEQLPEAKKSQMQLNRKLVFDCVSATRTDSADMARSGTQEGITSQEGIISAELMWARMKSWFLDEGICVCREEEEEEEEEEGEVIRLVVESVVRNEVVGKRWVEFLGLEIDNLGLEIEGKLLEEALDEVVIDLW